MILSTHAVVGGALAGTLTSDPALGFMIGCASHFALDMVPHWDYELRSRVGEGEQTDIQIGHAFPYDLMRVALDAVVGCAVIIGVGWYVGLIPSMPALFATPIIWGAFGGMLPDPLQFAYFKWPHEPLKVIFRIHHALHWWHPYGKIRTPMQGVLLQSIVWIVALMLLTAAV